MKKRESLLGLISVIIAVLSFIVYFGAYFINLEIVFFLFIFLLTSALGIVLGILGIMISLIQKRTRKRMSVWGILLNVLFIFVVIGMFIFVMDAP